MVSRSLLVLALALMLCLPLCGCRKGASQAEGDAVSGDATSEDDVKSEKKARKGAKARKKKGKGAKAKGDKKERRHAKAGGKGEDGEDEAGAVEGKGEPKSGGMDADGARHPAGAGVADRGGAGAANRGGAGAANRGAAGAADRGGASEGAAGVGAIEDVTAGGLAGGLAGAGTGVAGAGAAGAGERGLPPAAGVGRGLPPPPSLVAVGRLLTVADLSMILPEKGWISQGPIQGQAPSEVYNSMIYVKPGTSSFVSVQAWDFETYAQAVEKWNELLATFPNAEEQKKMFTDVVFFSYRNQVSTLAFVEPDHQMVISVSCHSQACDDTGLYDLAKTAYARAH